MINEQLIKYVGDSLAKGSRPDLIIEVLKSNGWKKDDIDQAFEFFSMQKSAPIASNASKVSLQQSKSPIAPVSPTSSFIDQHRTNSPYSVILAILLLISLATLAINLSRDLEKAFFDNSARLIISAVVALLLMGIAFAMNYFLSDQQRFRLLHVPYFLVAGYMLLRLLFMVSKFILDNNAVYGVYIVLLMMIAVLTAIIVFVQKYIIHKG